MPEARHDFGLATRLDADAVGEPGKRIFRLLVRSGSSSALIWLEKEQLQALAMAIEQVLLQVAPEISARQDIAELPAPVRDFPLNPTVELQVGRLQLGYDASNEQFLLLAHDVQVTEEQAPPTFAVRTGQQTAARLGRQIAAVVSAGRLRCPLCGQPFGPEPHHCPFTNGQVH